MITHLYKCDKCKSYYEDINCIHEEGSIEYLCKDCLPIIKNKIAPNETALLIQKSFMESISK